MKTTDIRSIAPDAVLSADVCIIGAGPAGITIASELAASDVKVVLLESGGREPDPSVDELNELDNVGSPRVLDQSLVRNRALGGSSWTWWGRSATLDATDFSERSWVPGSGWPITRPSMEPYVQRSAAHLGLGFADNAGPAVRTLAPLTPGGDLMPYVWTYSRDDRAADDAMRFGPTAAERDLPGVRCYVHATVTQLEPDPMARSVRRIEVTAPDGQHRFVRSGFVVLSGGGIENARLLLASDRIAPRGLGNEHDLVGRYLMDHLRGSAATFRCADFGALQRVLGPFRTPSAAGAVRVYPGVALSPQVQERERLLNAAAWVEGSVSDADPLRALAGLARLRSPAQNVRSLLRHAPSAAESIWRTRVRHRSAVRVRSDMNLQVIVEQQPDRDSRITLSTRTDSLGMPIAVIDWRIGEPERLTAERTATLFVERMRARGLPTPDLLAWVTDRSVPMPLLDAAHPTGTTRMSADPRDGVVDAACRVHGMDNLYIAGSSVFPTTGHANPTQMIVALAIRLADELKTQLRTSGDAGVAVETGSHLEQEPRPDSPEAAPAGALDAPGGRPLVLVTGANGTVGRQLLPRLIEEGYAVRALTSRVAPPPTPFLQWRVHDLRQDDLDFRQDAAGCFAIVHLAVEQRDQDDMPRVNAEATAALARAAEDAGVRFMCYTSSISVYGSSVRQRTDETSALLTADRDVAGEYWVRPALRAYGRSKLQGELALAATANRVEYVVLRPTVIVDETKLTEFMGITGLGRISAGKQRTHAINVEDVAEAIVWTLLRSAARERATSGVTVYNLSDEVRPQTFSDLFRAAERLAPGANRTPPSLPRPLILLQKWLQDGRRLPARLPMGLTSYPADRLYAEGYRHRFGLEALTDRATTKLASERAPAGFSASA